ncbi:hypothetical protein TTHERM_000130069 (macronuclear) [Tetrahymena thermophila SB210]|uniref:Uncharacterized protein n=1 Tax=Tetrahymena thermophila (strain SB210) TaxID=312017 RepID=W7XCP3_TETTS|nr:hypothetical protein TTHERM_000130069 [Tetrahymena thermophila SB210]EWS74298.1 hypothetical protein TTHERM_000130069 [Tetrahymena thermophila SB210]|eukprot:XP_012653119.1 hypothetical protein TTHERM_000130069 [Tetrahymena thermophila SB210]
MKDPPFKIKNNCIKKEQNTQNKYQSQRLEYTLLQQMQKTIITPADIGIITEKIS